MGDSQEYFWGCELTKEKPKFTWTFQEEDEDSDYLIHTLFLKHAVLGTSALEKERNVVQIETKNFDKEDLKQPLLSLTLGQQDMCNLDVSFGNESPVTFTLVEGAGPVAIAGQQLVEFPVDEMASQDESNNDDSVETDLTEEESPKKAGTKRKAANQKTSKTKKGKREESMSSADDDEDDEDEDEEEDHEDDDDEEDMDDDDTAESSPEKEKKKQKKKAPTKKATKTTKASPKKSATKKTGAKKGKN